MSPFEIDIVVWYYGHADDHPVLKRDPPILAETMKWFLDADLLRPSISDQNQAYKLTDRGRCWVEHICSLELPVWRMP